MGQPVEKGQPASQPDTLVLGSKGPALLSTGSGRKTAASANPPANPPRMETCPHAEAEDATETGSNLHKVTQQGQGQHERLNALVSS